MPSDFTPAQSLPQDDAAKNADIQRLLSALVELAPHEAVALLSPYPDSFAVSILQLLNPAVAQDVLDHFPPDRAKLVLAAAPIEVREQWRRNEQFPEGTLGHMMNPAVAIFRPETTIAETVEALRPLVKRLLITYVHVADENHRLVGVVVMRDMLLARREQRLEEVMIRSPFFLTPEMSLSDAMKAAVTRHYPEYPVCDSGGRLIGLIRGETLFETQAFELSAQAGTMVGVEKEERLSTSWLRSLKMRHPWLQLNLLTAFVAAAVVGVFEGVIDRIVVLAVFLPVLAGQSGNTGCQALAVTLRGLTLGELTPNKVRRLVGKEALLGTLNGALVGLTAGLGMFVYASLQKNSEAGMLAFIVFVAMTASCVISGVSGALVPLTLKRLGADPATASSIFLTTATDVASMGTFLGLATLLI